MTAKSSTQPLQSRWYFPWIMLALGLILGFFIGRYALRMAMAAGDCIRADGTVLARNVSQQSCQATCRTCTWVQGK